MNVNQKIYEGIQNSLYGSIQHQVEMINVNRRLLSQQGLDLDQVHHLACALKGATERLGKRLVLTGVIRHPSEYVAG